jgi:hypothetical protein
MASQYLLKPVRSLRNACADLSGCARDIAECQRPGCRLVSICPLGQALLACSGGSPHTAAQAGSRPHSAVRAWLP